MGSIEKRERKYFPESFEPENWETVEPEVRRLVEKEIASVDDLEEFIYEMSELTDIVSEAHAWRYISMTRFPEKEHEDEYNRFYSEIIARSKPFLFKMKKKIYESPFKKDLDQERFGNLLRILNNDIELFREENIPLEVEERKLSNRHGELIGSATVEFRGEEKTLIQLRNLLRESDRDLREEAWRALTGKLVELKPELDDVFDRLRALRDQQARIAGFDNYRDYMHKKKGRFSYSVGDAIRFHKAVEEEVVPFVREVSRFKAKKMGLDALRPWDEAADPDGKVLRPFRKEEELIEKSVNILSNVKPEFGERLNLMRASGLLDLENRKGKRPGGYNYPLSETGAPFIFMNAVGSNGDVRTILHESGHAMHTFSTTSERISEYRDTPSEAAELASMAMELLTLEHLGEFYTEKKDLEKALRDQLLGTLYFLPWCMTVDTFQHWIYTNPNHNAKERDDYFLKLSERFNTGADWTDLERERKLMWLMQLHIFVSPFYYIEYGIAQLGALALWRNYKASPNKAVGQYEDFLKLGYSKPLDQLYRVAGIEFSFSGSYLAKLVSFVRDEVRKTGWEV